MKTTEITLQLPQGEIRFLKEYTKRHKMTINELFDSYVKQLQQREGKGDFSAIDAELEEHTGIIPPHTDVELEYYHALEEKHQ